MDKAQILLRLGLLGEKVQYKTGWRPKMAKFIPGEALPMPFSHCNHFLFKAASDRG